MTEEWVERAVEFTRHGLRTGDEEVLERRDRLVRSHGHRARLRLDDMVLVLYPEEWVEDGEVRFEEVEDVDRALEVELEPEKEWGEAHSENKELLSEFGERVEDHHVYNARVFTEFLENHYSISVMDARQEHVNEFLEEFYPRNAWPSRQARVCVDESVEMFLEFARE